MRPTIPALLLAATLAGPASRAAEPPVPPFQVAVSLSPQAAARLAALGESITVAATFFGEPTREARNEVDRLGRLNLGREEVVIPGAAGAASFTGATVDPTRVDLIRGQRIQVLINVYSARRVARDNLLNCDVFQGPLKKAVRMPLQIVCRLIAEPV